MDNFEVISDSGSDTGNAEVTRITANSMDSFSPSRPVPVKRRASMGKWTILEDDLLRKVRRMSR
jgi:c-di-AMP phosphodiesterase-like protein